MQQKTKEEKEELVQLYKQSGMSIRAFVEEFELNLGTFWSWLYKKPVKSRPADEKCSFVELETVKVRQSIDSQNIRVQKSGMEIFIPVNLGMPILEKIFRTIKAI